MTETHVQEERREQVKGQKGKEKRRAKDSIPDEDICMKDRSVSNDGLEDLSRYEQEEDKAMATTPPVVQKQAARRQAAKQVGRQSPPAKIPPN